MERGSTGCARSPEGKEGHPSKALTLDQAEAVLKATEGTRTHAYVVLSLLIGARTEELRTLVKAAGLLVKDWGRHTETRHSSVSPLPDSGVPWRTSRVSSATAGRRSRRRSTESRSARP
ncbi:hypothetical protein ACIBLB_05340 [Streptosporangium canum]|uniref:hypothetical protein n=1 Tax=Streptosporangium canum TaxID=324952 RepID=UPI003794948A